MLYPKVEGAGFVDSVHLHPQALQEEKVIHCLRSPKIKKVSGLWEVNTLPSSIPPVIVYQVIALSIEMFRIENETANNQSAVVAPSPTISRVRCEEQLMEPKAREGR